MPSFRRVSFSDRNHYSRQPYDDELYVIKAFARHADRCDSCYDPYQAYRNGSTLCPRGHERALDVAQYVYTKAGQAYSQVDRERNQRVQIEIPANCEAVRLLLKAMDRGLRVMRRHAPTSYDRTYYVPARLSVPDNQRSVPATRPLTPAPTSSKRTSSMNPGHQTPTVSRHQQPQSQSKQQTRSQSRSRATSTSSTSSDSSAAPRSSRGAWVRSRSKDGKRTHSPISVRPGRRTSHQRDSSQRSSGAKAKDPHSRNGSHSSSSSSSSANSRSSSLFSGNDSNGSRTSSISSVGSQASQGGQGFKEQHYAPVLQPIYIPSRGQGGKIAFRTPVYSPHGNEDGYTFETIAPRAAGERQR